MNSLRKLKQWKCLFSTHIFFLLLKCYTTVQQVILQCVICIQHLNICTVSANLLANVLTLELTIFNITFVLIFVPHQLLLFLFWLLAGNRDLVHQTLTQQNRLLMLEWLPIRRTRPPWGSGRCHFSHFNILKMFFFFFCIAPSPSPPPPPSTTPAPGKGL